MSGSEFNRIDALFHAALDRPETERESFLEHACGGDAALLRRLCAMLAQDSAARDPVADAVHESRRRFGGEASMPERIGPFRLIRKLGQGGMGTVWLGEREDADFCQQVAVKLLRQFDASATAIARLRRERRLLAQLEHPNIARLVDGGELEDGTPFVAMEYVDGENLLGHVQSRSMGAEARLRLFLQLLDVVAYAHRHLIVHRDLKPENVLVDREGTLKLLDFGIAKLIDADAANAVPATMTVAGAMTPSYASPEQLLGRSVSTQSDVYSLGVMLYELLTGNLPFPPQAGMSPLELQRRICTTQPALPSRAPRQDVPARRLRGDLDNIVLKALRKEPQRRYASVDAFADDIRAHLAGRTVSARPDSWRYRTSKFVTRNPAGVAIAAVLLISVLAFAVLSRWQAERLAVERDRAEGEAAAARQVAEYMVELFRAPDPRESLRQDLSARDLLDRAARSLDTGMDTAPLLRARLMHVVGLSYANIGAYEPSVHLLESALAIREQERGADSAEVADSLNRLGNIHRMYGRLGLAEAALLRALEIRRALDTSDNSDLADSYNNVGLLQYQIGHYTTALDTLQRAIDMHRRLAGSDNLSVAIALHNRSLALRSLGRYDEARVGVLQAITIKTSQTLEDRTTLVNSRALLASVLFEQGDLQGSFGLRMQTLARYRQLYPDGHPSLVHALLNTARLQLMLGHAETAERLIDEAETWTRRLDSGSQELLGRVLVMRGRLALALGDWRTATGVLGMAVDVRAAALAADDPSLAEAHYLLGLARFASSDLPGAHELLEQAQRVRRLHLPAMHPDLREIRLAEAAIEAEQGDGEAARTRLISLLEDSARGTLRSDLVSARAHRCLAQLTETSSTELPGRTPSGERQAADALLGRYFDAEHPLRASATAPCPGLAWLKRPVEDNGE